MYRRYYHVTHEQNVENIIDNGLNPLLARGKLKASWLVDSQRLTWAIGHVAANHNWHVRDLWALVLHVDPRSIGRFRWRGVFTCQLTIFPYTIYGAKTILDNGPIRLIGDKRLK